MTMKEIAKKFEDIGFPVESSRELTTEDGIITYPSITFPQMALDCKNLLIKTVNETHSNAARIIPIVYDYDTAESTVVEDGASKITLMMEAFTLNDESEYCHNLGDKYEAYKDLMLEVVNQIISSPLHMSCTIKEMIELPYFLSNKINTENSQFILSIKAMIAGLSSSNDPTDADRLVVWCRDISIRNDIAEAFDIFRFQIKTRTLQALLNSEDILTPLYGNMRLRSVDNARKVIESINLRDVLCT